MIVMNNEPKIKVFSAMNIFNELLRKGVLQQKISDRAVEFDKRWMNMSNKDLAQLIESNYKDVNVNIKFFYPRWYMPKPYARVLNQSHKEMQLNGKMTGRSMPSLAGTIGHEWVHNFENHCAKFISSDIVIGHGDNSLSGKDNSVPVYIGRQVMHMAEGIHNELIKAKSK